MLGWQFLYVTNRNRIRAVLGQVLKETSILNPSDFGLIPLDIKGLLGPVLLSINHKLSSNKVLARSLNIN